MILLTVGTIIFPFNRLVDWLEVMLTESVITEPVLFQYGSTAIDQLRHPLLTLVPSLTRQEMQDAVRQSSLVLSHAGQGSTRMLAEMQARFILLPRLKRHGEHVDDHQLWFAESVEKFGIHYCTELDPLIQQLQDPPDPFQGELFNAPSLVEYLVERYSTPVTTSQRSS